MKTLVIGAGASGMMAAIKASEKGKVKLIEKNEKPGKKMYITGKGRCNVTNACDISDFFLNIPRNSDFLYSALYTFNNDMVMEFFRSRGCKLKVERGNRVFPISDKASDVIKVLDRELEKCDVITQYNTEVKTIILNESRDRIERVVTSDGIEKFDNYIIATGGASYPLTGSNGAMLKELNRIGIKTIPFTPSLSALKVVENENLAGVTLKNITWKVLNGKKKVYEELGELLFTHDGVSGPLVLSSSAYMDDKLINEGKYKGSIDLKPALSEEELDNRILKDFQKYLNKDIKNGLSDLLIQRLIPIILKRSNIDEDKKVNSITKDERKELLNNIKNFKFSIKAKRPIEEAIVSRGGVDVKEIDPSTMRSKKISNLYFAGELVDVDALTGGFNLQIAFATGYLAGISIEGE